MNKPICANLACIECVDVQKAYVRVGDLTFCSWPCANEWLKENDREFDWAKVQEEYRRQHAQHK